MAYTTKRGEQNGVSGTYYFEQAQGGPGNYPYTITHFVSDAAVAATDTRNASATDRPWELYKGRA